MAEHVPLRERLEDLNTKVYYLVAALSFLSYGRTDVVVTPSFCVSSGTDRLPLK